MAFVLSALLRSGVPGIGAWSAGLALAGSALLLHAFGAALLPAFAYEVANGLYAAAAAFMLAGFRRFFKRRLPWAELGVGVASVVTATAFFHYGVDAPFARVAAADLFQCVALLGIAYTVLQARKAWHARHPYWLTLCVAALAALGHAVRSIVYLTSPDYALALPSSIGEEWFAFVATFVLPLLGLGAMMMVHDLMLEKAAQATNRDFLTGAWSHRSFFQLAEREMLRSQRNGRHLSLLLLDVDNFRHINDNAGRSAGDQVLVDVVLRAENALRSIDYFSRLGGSEFAALLPETDRAAAVTVAERLRLALERRQTIAHPPAVPAATTAYTVSVGVAVLRGPESCHELMRRADAALYAAKATGRNRVVCEPE